MYHAFKVAGFPVLSLFLYSCLVFVHVQLTVIRNPKGMLIEVRSRNQRYGPIIFDLRQSTKCFLDAVFSKSLLPNRRPLKDLLTSPTWPIPLITRTHFKVRVFYPRPDLQERDVTKSQHKHHDQLVAIGACGMIV